MGAWSAIISLPWSDEKIVIANFIDLSSATKNKKQQISQFHAHVHNILIKKVFKLTCLKLTQYTCLLKIISPLWKFLSPAVWLGVHYDNNILHTFLSSSSQIRSKTEWVANPNILRSSLLLFSVTIIIANDNKWKVSSYSGDAPEAHKNKHIWFI